MTQERIYREEQQYFQKVIQEIRRQIDNLGPRYYGVDSYVHGEENLGISDEYLLYRLGENKDHRLR